MCCLETTKTVLGSCCADSRDIEFVTAYALRMKCSPMEAQTIVNAISENLVRILIGGVGIRMGQIGSVYPREIFKRIDGTKEFMRRLFIAFDIGKGLRNRLKEDLENETEGIPTSVLRKIAIDERMAGFDRSYSKRRR